MSKRKTLLIFGHYGVPNWGDEAILAGMLSQINMERWRVVVVSSNPQFTKSHSGVKGVYPPPFGIRSFFTDWWSFFQELKSADLVAFGGGGLFQDSPPKAFLLWRWYFWICGLFQKKVIFLGNSFEPFKKPKNQILMEKILVKVPFCSVRDSLSAKNFPKNLQDKISLSTDAAYFLPFTPKKGRKTEILLSFREGELSQSQEKGVIKFLQEAFSEEWKTGKITVLSMQSHQSSDEKFAKRHALPVCVPQNVLEVQERIASAKYVLTTRLHAGILASIVGTPFTAIATRKKISQFFGEKFSVFPQKFLSSTGKKKFLENLQHLPAYKKEILAFTEAQKEKLEYFFPEFLRS
ncbi:MAG: polysaccharide pyruvyl transferase family protein [Candidatus Peregrinibacteria bacterium]